ncbi:uncharacterized protein LTR77_001151 [Saxophila tyrrhenica]|uniref:Uncharacterized protein n=1 Tax=Saxophila tyrrhenica TaxID=1690608 RepID=A0AAV9PMS7_9PEZI|nr:hypothetical protein LTR77_001151 [Saxophila tyrrhenica]
MKYGTDYVTADGRDPVGRPHLSGTIFPDDGATPFLMQVTGVQKADEEVDGITANSSAQGREVPYGGVYSVWTPTFYGGDASYSNLQNSIFVGSETVSDGEQPGEFLVGIKISKVFPVKTDVVIGEEFSLKGTYGHELEMSDDG